MQSTEPMEYKIEAQVEYVLEDLKHAIEQKKYYTQVEATYKERLQQLYDEGVIPDNVSGHDISVSLQTRKTWVYSDAIKKLQLDEQFEGVATQKESTSWVIRTKSSADE